MRFKLNARKAGGGLGVGNYRKVDHYCRWFLYSISCYPMWQGREWVYSSQSHIRTFDYNLHTQKWS